ncbi:hydroxyacid dehydrogenase [Ruania halotolerans]|uniref:hydroxyacid dehydrogenase n=1 Tax=Ruania halotolerans TaxID=2897773 RepID=UPI001E577AE4|nr:hydroxyacid dehydrogenase [Ruania halotolerans]UFU06255.1 hydroxyacid dehydrogenase [Ruania halotolerans]
MIDYALAVGSARLTERLFGTSLDVLRDVQGRRVGDILHDLRSPASDQTLAQAEALVTGWDTPPLTADVLARAPRLRLVVHAGGGTDHLFPDGYGDLTVLDVGDVNAVPVAEYTLAMILLANKETFRAQQLYRHRRTVVDREEEFPVAGNYDRTIGVISASRIGRLVIDHLESFPGLRTLLYDPHPSARTGVPPGIRRVDLDTLLASSDVVTVHAPVLPETHRMIGSRELALLRDGATLINTARGSLIDAGALEAELVSGRIRAILDVTDPEPLPPGSPLYDLPHVLLTPHMAGSVGTELRRMGAAVADHLTAAAHQRATLPAPR